MKKCGYSYDELMSRIGSLSSLNNGDQLELTRLLDENNKAIKSYIDELTSSKNVAQNVVSQLANDLKRNKGMR